MPSVVVTAHVSEWPWRHQTSEIRCYFYCFQAGLWYLTSFIAQLLTSRSLHDSCRCLPVIAREMTRLWRHECGHNRLYKAERVEGTMEWTQRLTPQEILENRMMVFGLPSWQWEAELYPNGKAMTKAIRWRARLVDGVAEQAVEIHEV